MTISSKTGLKYYMKYFFPHYHWIEIENHLVSEYENIYSPFEIFPIRLIDENWIEAEELICKN